MQLVREVKLSQKYEMKSTVMYGLACFLCLAIIKTANCGYIPDLGLPPEALDFTPSDYKVNDFDFSQLANEVRRGDYEQQGGSDHDDKLPAPTSYQLYNLESKNPVPVTIKIKKMQSQPQQQPEWPQPPAWLQQDSGSDHMSDDESPPTIMHPIPSSSHHGGSGGSGGGSGGGYPGHGGGDSQPPAFGRHPPSGPSSHGQSSGGPPAHDFPPQDFSPPDKPWQGYNFEETD